MNEGWNKVYMGAFPCFYEKPILRYLKIFHIVPRLKKGGGLKTERTRLVECTVKCEAKCIVFRKEM